MDEPTSSHVPQFTFWSRLRALIKRLGPAGPLAVMSSTFPPLGGFVLLGFITRIAPWLQANPIQGLLIYITGFTLMAGLALLPTYACAILGGWTFGFAVGFPAAIFSFVAAALVAYLVYLRAAGNRVVDIIHEHPRWETVVRAMIRSGFWKAFWITMLIRLPPTAPFAATNFVMGTVKAPLLAFLLGTAVGMAPRTGVAVWAAAHASTLDFSGGSGQLWKWLLAVGVTVAVVIYIGQWATNAVKRATQPADEAVEI